ncbi:MAG: 5-formyltetrahydrofolate cyclo-ligase [Salinivirgaceae bacterium]|nr:5-formyltetrahydrofolate cyclo-ligase [Salinivirgaceae bacterium]
MLKNIKILDKDSLRRLVRQLKAQLSAERKQACADKVFAELEKKKCFADAQNIIAYWSMPDELPTHTFVEKWYRQKNIYLPVVQGDTLVFRRYGGMDKMLRGAFGILEPCGDELADLSIIDLVIVPGVAFDSRNNRMGRGRGFYDRFLPQTQAVKVGVAFECQQFTEILVNQNDAPMDEVIVSD